MLQLVSRKSWPYYGEFCGTPLSRAAQASIKGCSSAFSLVYLSVKGGRRDRIRHRCFLAIVGYDSETRLCEQVFNEDITGPEGAAIEVHTATNGSFEEPFGNFTLRFGVNDTTWPLPFDATADEIEEALEVREPSSTPMRRETWVEHIVGRLLS